MEPIFSYGGLELSIAELILGGALLLLGVLGGLFASRRSGEQVSEGLKEMAREQAGLHGRLSQLADESAAREAQLKSSLDTRLDQVSQRVGQSLTDTNERSTKALRTLHERLALIDKAQRNIETLSTEVSGLQSLLSNKQARGAFGEKQMRDMIADYLPPDSYSFQATLSNNKRVDALIHMPKGQGDVAIDSKFPMEAWRRLTEAENTPGEALAQKAFARDVLVHIKAVSEKYLIFGETHDAALLFLPSEAIYGELHTNFQHIVDKAFKHKVMIVSPTTFMATLHTMRAVMKDAAMREQSHIIQKEVGILAEDVARLEVRTQKLQSHMRQAGDDLDGILTSAKKISKRADRVTKVDLPDETQPDLLDAAGQR